MPLTQRGNVAVVSILPVVFVLLASYPTRTVLDAASGLERRFLIA